MDNLNDVTATGEAVGKTTGDSIKIKFTVTHSGVVCGAGFESHGCEEITEVCDTVINMIDSNAIDYALMLKDDDVISKLSTVNEKSKMCVSIALDAVKKAIGDYYTNIGVFPKEENHCCCCEKCGN